MRLPVGDGSWIEYAATNAAPWPETSAPSTSRVAYAAAHVVADPLTAADPTTQPCVDWDATLAFRHVLWGQGLAVAEAMDTAQRGMGLDWTAAQELIRRAVREALATPGAVIACGAGTDQLSPQDAASLEDVAQAYETQVAFVEAQGARVILMASRALAALATSPEDYIAVYDRILAQVQQPVIIHWLGDMFDPALTGYWGSRDLAVAMDVCVDVLTRHAAKIDGVKLSLLDDAQEITLRSRLPAGVRMYTGDDFNYPDLILGDGMRHSDALLGVFDPIAPAAAAALQALDAGDVVRYEEILAPTVPFARHLFAAPTRFYKTGVVFMAYLNGYQDHFRMIGAAEGQRSTVHLARLFMLADQARLLRDPDLANDRMRRVLSVAGVA
ncbi:MAG: dihydrodipicolinate synthase family protein [Thermomicrobiales bacterium]